MQAVGWQNLFIVTAIAATVLLTNLGGPRLWDRDEPRNAGCAREMLEAGNWTVPVFNAELRTHKPILLYWLIMSAYSVLGVNEFSARLPSALCGIGTVIATYLIGRRLFSASAALWAGIALATSLMFVVAGRAATPDSVLIFCSTAALAVYVCGTFALRDDENAALEPQLRTPGHYFPQDIRWAAALYAVMGLAVLAKGPVGLVLPTAVIGMFLLIVRLPAVDSAQTRGQAALRLLRPFSPLHFLKTCWYMRPILALAVAGAVALPWYIAVAVQTDGQWLKGFFFEHNVGRATQAMEGHSGGPLFYPLALLVGCFPWSVLALPIAWETTARLRRSRSLNPALVFSLCWIGVFVGLFSLAKTKLPSYITPCYPAVALLVGHYLARWWRGELLSPAWLAQLACGVLVAVGIALAVALPIAAHSFLPGEEWLGVIGLVPIWAGGLAWVATRWGRQPLAAISLAAGAVLTMVLFFAVGTERVDAHQKNHLMLQAIFLTSDHPRIAAYRTLEPTWVFYGGQPIETLPTGDVESLAKNRPQAAKLAREQAANFLAEGPNAFLITTSSRLGELTAVLPDDVEVVSDTPLFLKDERLLVLRRASPPSPARTATAVPTAAAHRK